MNRKIVISTVLFIAILGVSLVYIYVKGTGPLEEQYETALQRSREIVRFSVIDQMDWFHYDEAYTVIEGRDEDGTRLIVWVPEREDDDIRVAKASEGLSKSDALALLQNGLPELSDESRPREVIEVKYGLIENNPVYEISYYDRLDRYSILYLDFYKGEWFKVYNL